MLTDLPSDSAFNLMKSWLEECLLEPKSRCHTNDLMALPKRLLDVGTPGQLRLIDGQGLTGQWFVLSHCWGTGESQPMKTTLANVGQHFEFIDIADLPATFQDAVLITQKLGHQYLWIDSLCIIQDSPEDWSLESFKMNYIYQNAKLTIMAESAHNSHEGIFASSKAGRKEVKVHPFSIEAVSQGSRLKGKIFFRDPIPSSCQDDSGPLSNRAWVLQEELLSARILRFAPNQIYWQCQTVQFSESDPTGSSVGSHWRGGPLLATVREPINLIPTGLVDRRYWHDYWMMPRW